MTRLGKWQRLVLTDLVAGGLAAKNVTNDRKRGICYVLRVPGNPDWTLSPAVWNRLESRRLVMPARLQSHGVPLQWTISDEGREALR